MTDVYLNFNVQDLQLCAVFPCLLFFCLTGTVSEKDPPGWMEIWLWISRCIFKQNNSSSAWFSISKWLKGFFTIFFLIQPQQTQKRPDTHSVSIFCKINTGQGYTLNEMISINQVMSQNAKFETFTALAVLQSNMLCVFVQIFLIVGIYICVCLRECDKWIMCSNLTWLIKYFISATS